MTKDGGPLPGLIGQKSALKRACSGPLWESTNAGEAGGLLGKFLHVVKVPDIHHQESLVYLRAR